MARCGKHRVKCWEDECGKCYRCTIEEGGCGHDNTSGKKRKVDSSTNGKHNVHAASPVAHEQQTLNEDCLAN
eukprot:2920042-Ditylum_brightwellii.AAC.1